MDYGSIYDISASGMDFQRLRLEVVAANIANAQSTSSNRGGVYQPMEAIAWVDAASKNGLHPGVGAQQFSGHNQDVVEKDISPRRVHNPEHPHADSDGFVYYPKINMINEMTNLMTASRAYEANVSVLNAAKSMALKALEIGR